MKHVYGWIYCCTDSFDRKRKSGKKDFAVSANKAYRGQVNLDYLGGANTSAASGDNEMYEDPDRMVKTGCTMMGTYITS